MVKVAYLIGISGSGKGCVAAALKGVQIIELDCVRDKAEHRLSLHHYELPAEWPRCDSLLACEGVSRVFSEILSEYRISKDRPILAEGISLGHKRWREAFRAALLCQKITITDERVFWIDPPPDLVWKHRRQRKRKDQLNESVEDVRKHQQYYVERVIPDQICRHESSEEAVQAIQGFFLS